MGEGTGTDDASKPISVDDQGNTFSTTFMSGQEEDAWLDSFVEANTDSELVVTGAGTMTLSGVRYTPTKSLVSASKLLTQSTLCSRPIHA